MWFAGNSFLWIRNIKYLKEKFKLVQWNKGGKLRIHITSNLQKEFIDNQMIENEETYYKNFGNVNRDTYLNFSNFINCLKFDQDHNIP